MANEIYNRTVFKRFFDVNDEKVLAWANNVLEKVMSPGILPTFIKKDSEDFAAFWGTITHLFALVVLYGRQYNEISTNKILFDLFIENRGLVTNEVTTDEQMQYLFDNYINEYKKRGKLDIISKEGIILGELLRLLQYNTLDEFIFALLMSRDTGWTLGYSSPTWNRTDTVLNITKGYETTTNVEDLDKYPLVNETGVTLVPDVDNDGNPIQAMTFVGNVLTGISSEEDKSKLLSMSENMFYQLSFKLKVSDVENQTLKFGVEVYDDLKRPLICKESYGDGESNNFVLENRSPVYKYNFSTDLPSAFPNVSQADLNASSSKYNNLFVTWQQDGLKKNPSSTDYNITGNFSTSDYKLEATGITVTSLNANIPKWYVAGLDFYTNAHPIDEDENGAVIFQLRNSGDGSRPSKMQAVVKFGGFDSDLFGIMNVRYYIESPKSDLIMFYNTVPLDQYYINVDMIGGANNLVLYRKTEAKQEWPSNVFMEVLPDVKAEYPINMKTFFAKDGINVLCSGADSSMNNEYLARVDAAKYGIPNGNTEDNSMGLLLYQYQNTTSSPVTIEANPTSFNITFFAESSSSFAGFENTRPYFRTARMDNRSGAVFGEKMYVTWQNSTIDVTLYGEEETVAAEDMLVRGLAFGIEGDLPADHDVSLVFFFEEHAKFSYDEGGDEYSYDFEKDLPQQFPNQETPYIENIFSGNLPVNNFCFYQQDGKPFTMEDGSTTIETEGTFTITPYSMSISDYVVKMDGVEATVNTFEEFAEQDLLLNWFNDQSPQNINAVFKFEGIDFNVFSIFAIMAYGDTMESMNQDGFLITEDSPFLVNRSLAQLYMALFRKTSEEQALPSNITLSVVPNAIGSYPFKMNEFFSDSSSFQIKNELATGIAVLLEMNINGETLVNFSINATVDKTNSTTKFLLARRLANPGTKYPENTIFPISIADKVSPLNVKYTLMLEKTQNLPSSFQGIKVRKFWIVVDANDKEVTTTLGEEILLTTGNPVNIVMYDNTRDSLPQDYSSNEGLQLVYEGEEEIPVNALSFVISLNPEIESTSPSPSSNTDGVLRLPNSGVYYDIKGILSKKNRSYLKPVDLNFLNGRGLKCQEGMKYLSLSLLQDRTQPSSDVYIYDIKIKPLFLPFYQGYLGEKNIIASYYENNSSSSNETVNAFIEKYLISYRNVLASQEIYEFKLTKVLFKVFSDRRVQLENAAISIGGYNLLTDINGEAFVELYSGDFLYTIKRSGFISIENEVLSVVEEDLQTVYITLEGDLYERTIIFSVKNVNGSPISGAVVTFNGVFKNTLMDGTATFMAFPGLYPYTVTKDKYQDVNKSILVQDDMTETVEMELIPVSNITFVVKNGNNPIEGVTISVNGLDTKESKDTNALPYFQSKQTDATGTAVFNELVNGNYTYSAEKIDWIPVSANMVVNGDKTINIDFNPVPTYTVIFDVTDVNTFTGEKVKLQGATVTYAGSTKTTNVSGQASFVVKGNSYSYTISKSGYVTQTGTYRPTADVTVPIDIPRNTYKITFKVTGYGSSPLNNAAVKVGDKTLYTNSQGQVVFDLPNASYNWEVKYTDYTTKTGSVTVNSSSQTITVAMDQVLYNTTFTVTEEGLVSSGATVRITNQDTSEVTTKTTSNQGIVVFQLPKGTYTWQVSKTNYVNQTGSFVITGSSISRDINLIRKNGDVTFIVKDDSGYFVEGASITCGNKSGTTNSSGRLVLSLPVGSYTYNVSKLPDYTGTSGNVNVTETGNTVNVLLTNKTYSVKFNVTVEWGGYSYNQVSGLSVTFNGRTATTNSSGVATFNDIKNGTYNYSMGGGSTSYNSETGSVTVSGSDRTVDVKLYFKTVYSTVTVYMDNGRGTNVTVTGYVEYKNGYGNNYATINTMTDSYGQVDFACPAEGRFTVTAVSDIAVSKSTSGTAGYDSSIYLWTAWILSFSTSANTIINRTSWLNSSNSEADGFRLKVCPSYSGSNQPGNLSGATFENETALLSVDQWPGVWGFNNSNYTFSGCTNLNSVANGHPVLSGEVKYFYNCKRLESVPSNFFSSALGYNATSCFEGSAIRSVGGGLFSSYVTTYEYCFRNSSLQSVTGAVFGTGAKNLAGVFAECYNLSSVSSNTFYNCDYAEDMGYAFSNCTALKTVPSNLLQYQTRVNRCTSFFEVSGIQSIPSSFFNRINVSCNFTTVCYGCKSLSSIGSNAFPLTANNFYGAFQGCSSLTDITNIQRKYTSCTSGMNMFRSSGVNKLPGNFFSGWTSLTSLQSAFESCTNLVSITATSEGLVENCGKLSTVSNMFKNCSNFNVTAAIAPAFGKAENNIVVDAIRDYSYCFYGCSKVQYFLLNHQPQGDQLVSIYLWDVVDFYHPSFTKTQCFRNSAVIPACPSSWK